MKIIQITRRPLGRTREPFLRQAAQDWAWKSFGASELDKRAIAGADVAVVEYGWTGVRVARKLRRYGLPYLVRFHGADAHANPDLWSERYKAAEFGHIAGPSVFTARHLSDRQWAPNVSRFRYPAHVGSRRWNPGRTPFYMLWIGRDVAKKRPQEGLEAMMIAQRALGRHFAVSQIKQWLDHDSMLTVLGSAACLVHSSGEAPNGDCEGMPVTIIEALAMGVPVAAYAHAGIPEIVRSEYLASVGDVGELADRIKTAVDGGRDYKFSDDIRLHAPELCSIQLMEVLENVIG